MSRLRTAAGRFSPAAWLLVGAAATAILFYQACTPPPSKLLLAACPCCQAHTCVRCVQGTPWSSLHTAAMTCSLLDGGFSAHPDYAGRTMVLTWAAACGAAAGQRTAAHHVQAA